MTFQDKRRCRCLNNRTHTHHKQNDGTARTQNSTWENARYFDDVVGHVVAGWKNVTLKDGRQSRFHIFTLMPIDKSSFKDANPSETAS